MKYSKRDFKGKFYKQVTLGKIIEFEALLVGSVLVLGLMIYFWTPIAINAMGNQIASIYTRGF